MKNDQIFQREEKKYIITPQQKADLLLRAGTQMQLDQYGRSTIASLYFDTMDHRMIRQSMEKPLYKEKLRLRSYGVAAAQSRVYLELKKKYKGIVYKRREKMTLMQARRYIQTGILPFDTQIMREIDWVIRAYGDIKPVIYISYEREAYFAASDDALRMTFDHNLLYRTQDLTLTHGAYGTPILPGGQIVLEIKALGAMPLWLADALDSAKIYPSSFSKYGTAYCMDLTKEALYA
jgi:SPX domain protein involved in polyphosphate accumulation